MEVDPGQKFDRKARFFTDTLWVSIRKMGTKFYWIGRTSTKRVLRVRVCSHKNILAAWSKPLIVPLTRPRGLIFRRRRCYGLMSDKNQPSLPTPFFFKNSVLVSISVFMALSTVFHSTNSPDNSSFSHSVLPILSFCLISRSSQPYITL